MEFGIQINAKRDDVDQFASLLEDAEDAGFDAIFFDDGISLDERDRYDTFTAQALCAQVTSDVKIGPCVTNFSTRHPLVVAQAVASIDAFSGGGAVLGIGSGDTPVYSLGEEKASLKEMAEHLPRMRAFLDGESFEIAGRTVESTIDRPNVPILLAADGPKTLTLAGHHADGAVVGAGTTPEVIEWALDRVEKGVARAEDSEDAEVWVNTMCQIAPTQEEAREIIGHRILPRVFHNFRHGTPAVPDEHMAEVERFKEEYIENRRDPETLSHNLSLVGDYLWDRFAIAGPPSDCRDRFEALQASGVDRVIIATQRRDRQARRDLIHTFGDEVISELS